MGRPPEEAEVREWRATYSDPEALVARRSDEIIVRLCDSWLAQARVIDAARDDLRGVLADIIAVKPHLQAPYEDDARWTPWTRFAERALVRVDRVRAALAAGGETP